MPLPLGGGGAVPRTGGAGGAYRTGKVPLAGGGLGADPLTGGA